MSMYSELLAASMVDAPDSVTMEPGVLLAQFLACRRRLVTAPSEGSVPAATSDQLTHQLQYDAALLRLCGSLGIESDPADFDDLQTERRRLEDELLRAGVDLSELDEAAR